MSIIRDHLIENLSMERQDFDLINFTHAGGTWERVNRDLDGQLEDLVIEINTSIAQ